MNRPTSDQTRWEKAISLSRKPFQVIEVALNKHVLSLNPLWLPTFPTLLKSVENGSAQQPHADYTGEAIAMSRMMGEDCFHAFCIITLMDNTKLTVYEGNFYEMDASSKKTIEIPTGSCALCRGDLIHAGESFMRQTFVSIVIFRSKAQKRQMIFRVYVYRP